MTTWIHEGDVLDVLLRLGLDGAHTICTSPPYWGLRDYAIKPTAWPAVTFAPIAGLAAITIPAMTCCLGLELDPWAYVGHLVLVFRAARRVLRGDGTVWLNLGDCYAWGGSSEGKHVKALHGKTGIGRTKTQSGMKPKDLMGMPWRVALALQADGWWLRSDIVWAKPNPMPEATRDRPTKAHEMIFLLTKHKNYFYDAEAVAEPATLTNEQSRAKVAAGWDVGDGNHTQLKGNYRKEIKDKIGKNERLGKRQYDGFNERWKNKNGKNSLRAQGSNREGVNGAANREGRDMALVGIGGTRNRRSVWPIATVPCANAHFATFPPALPEICLKAGTSAKGCCPECGAAWVRVVEKGEPDLAHQRACGGDANGHYSGESTKDYAAAGAQDASATKARILAGMRKKVRTGWRPGCGCLKRAVIHRAGEMRNEKLETRNQQWGEVWAQVLEEAVERLSPVPCVAMDLFGGAGTVGLVAARLGLDCVLIEKNRDYIAMAQERLEKEGGMFADVRIVSERSV